MLRPGVVLAHQGGWDEVALVAGPIFLIVVALAIAKRRVDASAAASRVQDERPVSPAD